MARKTIFLIAGEASGDLLGATLMQALKDSSGDDVSFAGIGGQHMTGQGLQSLFPMTELSIMGVVEVLRHLPRMIKRINQTVEAILQQNPQVLVTIDAPDFGLRVARKIRKLRPEIRLIHYVAPTVWAWRPGRAKKIAAYLDGLMCLFPFEPPYFEKHGLKAQFVGHPLTRDIPEITPQQRQDFCATHDLDPAKPILCLLPGSRVREIESLAPVMLESVRRLKENIPGLQVILPTMPHLESRLSAFASVAKIFVPRDRVEKYTAFAVSRTALHASGTVALELALCDLPMVTVYRMNALSAWIGQFLVKTPYANLVNILLRHPAVPELIQDKMTPDAVTAVTQALLTDDMLYQAQLDQLRQVRPFLTEPSVNSAAAFVLSEIR